MTQDQKLEYKKGFKALDILSMLGYLLCFLYLIFGVVVFLNTPLPGILMILSAIVGALGVYVFNRIGHAAFIVRDITLENMDKGVG